MLPLATPKRPARSTSCATCVTPSPRAASSSAPTATSSAPRRVGPGELHVKGSVASLHFSRHFARLPAIRLQFCRPANCATRARRARGHPRQCLRNIGYVRRQSLFCPTSCWASTWQTLFSRLEAIISNRRGLTVRWMTWRAISATGPTGGRRLLPGRAAGARARAGHRAEVLLRLPPAAGPHPLPRGGRSSLHYCWSPDSCPPDSGRCSTRMTLAHHVISFNSRNEILRCGG